MPKYGLKNAIFAVVVTGCTFCVGVIAPPVAGQARTPTHEDDTLQVGFRDPPQQARPQVWWHWMSGNVTAVGARFDLDWMQRVGIGGVHIFAGGKLEDVYVEKPLPFMSQGWRDIFRSSVRQARQAGMDVAVAGSPGWSQTGGPWIKPAQAMKKYTWAVARIYGNGTADAILPPLPNTTGPMLAVERVNGARDHNDPTALFAGDGPVIAFPTGRDDNVAGGVYVSPNGSVSGLADAPQDLSRIVSLPLNDDGRALIDVRFDHPCTIRAVTLAVDPLPAFDVLASDDGRSFRLIRAIPQTTAERPAAQQTIAFAPAHGRVFRIRFARPAPWRNLVGLPRNRNAQQPRSLSLRLLQLHASPRIDHFEAKAGFQSIIDHDRAHATVARGIVPSQVLDLTSRVRADGTLDWKPKGHWMIVRFGWSLTGQTNNPAEPSATGLEADKLDPAAMDAYLKGLFSLYRDATGTPLGQNGINAILTDSWEAGVQNWTPTLLADFRRLRGYDATPWLPVLAGMVVADTRHSEAFLYDFRTTLKDLLVSVHYSALARAAHENGMMYYTEAQGDTPRAIGDGLAAKAVSDIPTAEFWYRPFATLPGQPSLVADLREAASAAHLYNKPLVAAEALTVAAGEDPWAFSPAMLKPVADQIFARGVNRILIHDSHLQPFSDRKPGLALSYFGQFFNRNDTWAEYAKPWVDYLSRCSWMLQQGTYQADVVYFYGEQDNLTQRFERELDRAVPDGYGFDYVDRDAVLSRLSVKHGMIASEGGMQYRILFVPPDVAHMSLAVVKRLRDLLFAGAVVVAPRPKGGLGMSDIGAAYKNVVAQVWGPEMERPVAGGVRHVGAGRLYAATSLPEVLEREGVVRDVTVPSGANVLSLHRRAGSTDIYYLANQSEKPVNQPIGFRVSGRVPEWWSPEDGSNRPLSYETAGLVTFVQVPLAAHGAGFVVFRTATTDRAKAIPKPRIIGSQQIVGPWTVRFEAGRGAPAEVRWPNLTDWIRSSDPGIKYFSGVATYIRHVHVAKGSLGSHTRAVLELGDVRDLAEVRINGQTIAITWHVPYEVDLSANLRPGENLLEIAVVNLWPNRLIGDQQPGTAPIAYAPQSPYRADSPLRSSGLLGPVRLRFETIGVHMDGWSNLATPVPANCDVRYRNRRKAC